MWPWRRRVDVVLASSAGDDTIAALTMILRYHRKSVTFDEVRRAIYEDRTGLPTALDVVHAAERFQLRGRGLAVEEPMQLAHIATPTIAHMMPDRGEFPRPRDKGLDGYFVVVASISPRRIRWIDPYIGQIAGDHTKFLELTSGIFLEFRPDR